MTDIREMNSDQIDSLNKRTDSKPDTKLAKKKKARVSQEVVIIGAATEQEVEQIVQATKHRSELHRVLDTIDIGYGIRVQGDIARLRSSVSALSKKTGKKFLVRASVEDAAITVIVRVEPEQTNEQGEQQNVDV